MAPGQQVCANVGFRVVHNNVVKSSRQAGLYGGESVMDGFMRAHNVKLKDHKLGPWIIEVDGIQSNAYHFFIIIKDKNGKEERKAIPYVKTLFGKRYLDMRHMLATKEMDGVTIEVTIVDATADLGGTARRFDRQYARFRLDDIDDVCPVGEGKTKDGRPFYSYQADYFSNFLVLHSKTLADMRKKQHAARSFGAWESAQAELPRTPQPFQRENPFERRKMEFDGEGTQFAGPFSSVPNAPAHIPDALVGVQPLFSANASEYMARHTGKGSKGEKEGSVFHHGSASDSRDDIVHSKKLKPIPISSLKSFKAAIFDLDGVIVDSEKAHLASFNKCLSPLGVKIDAKTWRRNYTGIGSFAIVKDVFRRNGIKENVSFWVKKRAVIYSDYIQKNGLPQIQGFAAVYKYLAENGVKVAVASGGHGAHIAKSLKLVGVPKVRYVGLESVKRRKPAPDLFLLAAKRLKVKPSRCIVFEDSLAGIEAAANARMPCIALSTTMPAKSLKGKAALIVKNFESSALKKLFSKLVRKRR